MPTDQQELRILIVRNGGSWYVRRVTCVVRDAIKDEMIYHCDEPLGDPYPTLDEAVAFVKETLQ